MEHHRPATGHSSRKRISKRQPETALLHGTGPSSTGPTPIHATDGRSSDRLLRGLQSAVPHFIPPMKCRTTAALPSGEQWIYEIKFDGYRVIAVKDGRLVHLYSRNHNDLSSRYETIAKAVRALPYNRLVLDGEVVALKEDGGTSFHALQSSDDEAGRVQLCYYVFDILNFNGRDVTPLALVQRKSLAAKAIADVSDPIRFSPALTANAEVLTEQARRLGLEGLIAKNVQAGYESGQRSGNWVKFKLQQQQEFVIGGYTPPKGTRKYFGSLLVGYYEGEKLIYAAKVGTGFNEKLLRLLHDLFKQLTIKDCPFANLPLRKSGRWNGSISRREMQECTWLVPKLVAQVRFTEWTPDGSLRHPAFLGLRTDKTAHEVVRESAGTIEQNARKAR